MTKKYSVAKWGTARLKHLREKKLLRQKKLVQAVRLGSEEHTSRGKSG